MILAKTVIESDNSVAMIMKVGELPMIKRYCKITAEFTQHVIMALLNERLAPRTISHA